MQRWIAALPQDTEKKRSRNALLQKELESSTRALGNVQGLDHGKYVMCHCDLLSGNVVIHPPKQHEKKSESEVSFIDYEYTTPGPAAFDLANHFAEWAGFECDYEALPTRSQRQAFISRYVDSYRHNQKSATMTNGATNGNETETRSDVDQLMREVDDFRGLPGLYWGIWALIQSMISQIEFDYPSYAEKRLGEYFAWKAEQDGSGKFPSNEIPLRERRWAQE